MTVKTRGIQLKKVLSSGDQGQQKLMQVTFAQLARLTGTTAAEIGPDPAAEPPTPPPGRVNDQKRRVIARMLRIELEHTLLVLDDALRRARAANADPRLPPA